MQDHKTCEKENSELVETPVRAPDCQRLHTNATKYSGHYVLDKPPCCLAEFQIPDIFATALATPRRPNRPAPESFEVALLKLPFIGNPPREQGKTGLRSSPR